MIRILHGDCLDLLPTLEAGSVQCCVTSPPYYGLRSYLPDGHPDKAMEIGGEPAPDAYVAKLVAVFRALWPVLRDDGTLWLNLGDSYANDTKWGGSSGGKHVAALHGDTGIGRGRKTTGLKPKDLLMIPARVALALQADGWYLRSDIIWHKPNPMPESVQDRPTSSYEHVFLLTKKARYYYDADAVREDRTQDEDANTFRGGAYVGGQTDNGTLGKRQVVGNKRVDRERGRPNGAFTFEKFGHNTSCGTAENGSRNLRNVWTIATAPFAEAHFATFPPELAERCIKAGSKPGDTILDPFAGAGTALLVADRLQRHGIGIELNPVYGDMTRNRVLDDGGMFAVIA